MSGASELVERLRIALEGVTPGPWRPSTRGFQIVSDAKGPCDVSVCEIRTKGYTEVEQVATAHYLALCSPDNIAALLAELARLSSAHSEAVEDARKHLAELSASRAEVVALREALEPFARFAEDMVAESGWTSSIHRDGISTWFGPSDFRRARAALAGEKPVGAGVVTPEQRARAAYHGDTVEEIMAEDALRAALSKSGEKP